jgi:transcriptional regulator with XRE-family HTH domain
MNFPNRLDTLIGGRLRLRRMSLAVSADELAAALGISTAQVQTWETGLSHIEARELRRLAVFLKVRPNFFFETSVENSAGR